MQTALRHSIATPARASRFIPLSSGRPFGHFSTTASLLTRPTMSNSKPDLSEQIPYEKQKALHLLTQSTPNGKKTQIALEELKAAYPSKMPEWSTELLNIGTNKQKEPWFLLYNPNGRIPTLVDNNPGHGRQRHFIMESGAQLQYLEKFDTDYKLHFQDPLEQNEMYQWINWQVGGEGPMQGQLNHFTHAAPEKIPYAIKRYHDETLRLYGVMELQLSGKYTGQEKDYLAGQGRGRYSFAEVAAYGWTNAYSFSGITEEEMDAFPHLRKWLARVGERAPVKEGTGPKYSIS